MSDYKELSVEHVEAAFDHVGWNWLRDKQGWYRTRIPADVDFGDLETEYYVGVREACDSALYCRLYGKTWFSDEPPEIAQACAEWNANTPFPKAVLLKDEDGDSKLLLEHVVSCWDEKVSQKWVNRLLEQFRSFCGSFLGEYSEVLRLAPRYVASPSTPQVH